MRDHMRQTEKDTIDVVTFLKKQDVDRDAAVNNNCLYRQIMFLMNSRSIIYNKR
jgi:hypothetical protein